jgi:CHAT domain-containing protein/Tfp pilus assembly protein PilF
MRVGGRKTAILLTTVAAAACSPHDRLSVKGAVRQSGRSDSRDLLATADTVYGHADYDSALVLYRRVGQDALGDGDSLRLARALAGQAFVARHQGRYDEADSTALRALDLSRRRGDQHEVAKLLNALGLFAQDRGRLDDATQRFNAALAVADSAHDTGYLAKARGNLGLVYKDLGEYDLARKAMTSMRDAAIADSDEKVLGNALNNLGMVETLVGDPDGAIRLVSEARVHYRAIDDPVGLENSSGQLGYAYLERGELSKSLAYFDSALAIASIHGMSQEQTDDLVLMAQVYEHAGDYMTALSLLARARALAESAKAITKLGTIAFIQAFAYSEIGNQTLAQRRAREASDSLRAAGARMDELEAQLFLAKISQRAGDSVAAKASLSRADSLTRNLGWKLAQIRFSLGAARVADAARHPRDVLAILDTSQKNRLVLSADEQAEINALRAHAYLQVKEYAKAAAAGRQAVAELERIRRGLGPGSLRSSYLADRATVYSDLVVSLLALGQVDDAFRVADEGRGRSLVEHLGGVARDLPPRVSSRDTENMERLLRRIQELVERLRVRDTIRGRSRSPAIEDGTDARDLFEARREFEALLARSSRADSTSAEALPQVDVASIRRSLGASEALLEYLSTPEKLLLFVVTRDRLQWVEIPAGSAQLLEPVRLARDLISARSNAVDRPLRALYDKLIGPAKASGFLAGIDSLVIVPHAVLNYLPFAALRAPPANGTSRFLVEEYAITTITSASALTVLRNRPELATDRRASAFAPLPASLPSTLDEARAIGRELGGADVVEGKEATEPALREALMHSRIVHVASHGVLNPDSPMFSNLEIATPAGSGTLQPDNDGRLDTYEVLSMNVRSWLVFLSGCETALGYSWSNEFSRHDDYATLAQAFLFAGARNVVATLWRIDDRGAADFARAFYGSLSSMSPGSALASAQRAFIRDPRYAAPYYWAGYVLSGSGDGRP